MSPDERADAPEPSPPDRKARDAALILPLAGAVALLPPVAWVVVVDGRILGVPVVVAYVFAVWAALILAAWRLAGRLGPRGSMPGRGGRGG